MKQVILAGLVFLCISALLLSCAGGNNYYVVTTSAMEPNIMVGDKVFISPAGEYTYGDVVVVELTSPELMLRSMPGEPAPEKQRRIYRIIGLPNDTVEIKDNFCVINNVPAQTKFIEEATDREGRKIRKVEETLPAGTKIMLYIGDPYPDFPNNTSPEVVPQNEYFVLGDYRTASMDSRMIGSIPIDKIQGKVTKIVKGN